MNPLKALTGKGKIAKVIKQDANTQKPINVIAICLHNLVTNSQHFREASGLSVLLSLFKQGVSIIPTERILIQIRSFDYAYYLSLPCHFETQ